MNYPNGHTMWFNTELFVNNPAVHQNATQQIIPAKTTARSGYLPFWLFSCPGLHSSTKVHSCFTCGLRVLFLWATLPSPQPFGMWEWLQAAAGAKHFTMPCWIPLIMPTHADSLFNKLTSISTKRRSNLKHIST